MFFLDNSAFIVQCLLFIAFFPLWIHSKCSEALNIWVMVKHVLLVGCPEFSVVCWSPRGPLPSEVGRPDARLSLARGILYASMWFWTLGLKPKGPKPQTSTYRSSLPLWHASVDVSMPFADGRRPRLDCFVEMFGLGTGPSLLGQPQS